MITLPDSQPHALYRLYGTDGCLLYVGIARDLHQRMRQHEEKQPWWPEVAAKTAAWYPSYRGADRAETLAIAAERPRYNKGKLYGAIPGRPFETGLEFTDGQFLPGDVPLRRRIAADLNVRIVAGDLAAGERLPARTAVAAMYNVSEMTVTNAYRLLAEHGILTVVRGDTGATVTYARIAACFGDPRCQGGEPSACPEARAIKAELEAIGEAS